MEKNRILQNFRRLIGNDQKTYRVIPGNLMEAISMNGLIISRDNDANAETVQINSDGDLVEDTSEVFSEKGGVIVFSTDVNALQLSHNQVITVLKQKISTLKNRLQKSSKISKVIKEQPVVFNVTIGNFVNGRYKSKDGKIFNEKALSIEIIGIPREALIKIGEDLANEFTQETVLVTEYDKSNIYLVKP